MYHDSDNNLKYVEQTFNPMELRRVDTDDIKYFDILDTDKPLIQNA